MSRRRMGGKGLLGQESKSALSAVRFIEGEPDVSALSDHDAIEVAGVAYMERFYLRPGGYDRRLHHLLVSDPDRDMHDHPWDYTSVLLTGAYLERTPHSEETFEAPCVLHPRG